MPKHHLENRRAELELCCDLASGRGRDRTVPEPRSRLVRCRRCVRAQSPPAPPELHFGQALPEVKISGHLPFSLSSFLICMCAFAGEGRRRCFIIVPCPSGQSSTPACAPPSPQRRWPWPAGTTLFAAREDEDPDIRGPLAVSPAPTPSLSPSVSLTGGPHPSACVRFCACACPVSLTSEPGLAVAPPIRN